MKIDRGLKYFLYRLTALKAHLFAVCVFGVFSYPLLCSVLVSYMNALSTLEALGGRDPEFADGMIPPEYTAAYDTWESLSRSIVFIAFIAGAALVLLFFMGFPILRKTFGWLGNKSLVDNAMTMPLTFGEKFFGDFLSGLVVYILPHTLFALAGSLIMGGMDITFGYRQGLQNIIRNCMAVGIIMCLIFYCTGLFIFSLCGRGKKTVTTVLLYNAALPVIIVCGFGLYCFYGAGLEPNDLCLSELPDILAAFTPLTFLLSFVSADHEAFLSPGRIACALAVCTAAAAAAYFLIKNRRHERTGKPYVFGAVRYIASGTAVAAVTFAAALALLWNMRDSRETGDIVTSFPQYDLPYGTTAVLWFLSAFGLFAAVELTSGAKAKELPKLILRYIGYAGSGAALVLLLTLCRAYGISGYVPAVSDIASVSPGLPSLPGMSEAFTEDIGGAAALHRELIAADTTRENGAGGLITFRLSYKLGDGRKITRRYKLNTELFRKAYDFMYDSGAVKEAYTLKVYDGQSAAPPDSVYVDGYRNVLNSGAYVSCTKLREALLADAEKMTFERMFREPVTRSWQLILHGEYSQWLVIYPFFENTISLLADSGITLYGGEPAGEAYIIKAEDVGPRYLSEGDLPAEPEVCARVSDPQTVKELFSMSSVGTAYEGEAAAYYVGFPETVITSGEARKDITLRPITQKNAARAAQIYAAAEPADIEDYKRFVADRGSERF